MAEIVIDQTETPNSFKDGLRFLESCLRNTEDSVNIIEGLLHGVTAYYGADRTYVLETDWNLGLV